MLDLLELRKQFSLCRRQLDTKLTATQILAAMAQDYRPFALVGEWADGGALIGSEPLKEFDKAQPERVWETLDDLPDVGASDLSPDEESSFHAVGGGWFGYLGYQLAAYLERLPPLTSGLGGLPSCHLAFYDHLLHCDPQGQWWFEALWTEERAAELEHRYQLLRQRLSEPPPRVGEAQLAHFTSRPTPAQHKLVVARGIEHIRAGDIFQVNLCLRLESTWEGDPLALFTRAEEQLKPARAAYFAFPEEKYLVSLSPELFLRRRGREAITAPIKGTVSGEADLLSLTQSEKDRSENVMIVDLMRNDLGRVCESGSISVPALVDPESHLGVWHLVSRIQGRLKEGVGDAALLRATFPPGSVTGAPKVRAMELIAELETAEREVYTGAIGYVSPLGGLELSVAIRSFELSGKRIALGVGSGIVADSSPAAELEECQVKAEPLLQAIGGCW